MIPSQFYVNFGIGFIRLMVDNLMINPGRYGIRKINKWVTLAVTIHPKTLIF